MKCIHKQLLLQFGEAGVEVFPVNYWNNCCWGIFWSWILLQIQYFQFRNQGVLKLSPNFFFSLNVSFFQNVYLWSLNLFVQDKSIRNMYVILNSLQQGANALLWIIVYSVQLKELRNYDRKLSFNCHKISRKPNQYSKLLFLKINLDFDTSDWSSTYGKLNFNPIASIFFVFFSLEMQRRLLQT